MVSFKISQPTELRDCYEPKLSPALKVGALAGEMDLETKAYSLEQAAALHDCKRKTEADTALIDKHNAQVEALTHKPWWKNLWPF